MADQRDPREDPSAKAEQGKGDDGGGAHVLQGLRRAQDRLAHLLGTSVDARPRLVAEMMERNANEATSYWLQLVVSIGIATLGLVVGSSAVIIGAMLVAPLMGPIIALAMGLATGSPFLVLRAAGRILVSLGVAIGGAATIALLLPFHELNSEILARTSPTVLDLLTAGFCALAGVYASLRPGSDTATTAAGTSIGISLVPPLCASGFGLGTSNWAVAGGAVLLFLTNLVAIIFVGTLAFVAAGFNRVNVATLEREELAKNRRSTITAAVARRLAGIFESKAGPALRFLMPLVLLAAVYIPLRRALDEVAWQVRTRAAVQDSLRRQPYKIVQSRVRVERHEIDLGLVLLGKTTDADASRTRLSDEIRNVAGVVPRIEVLAIPDATAFAGLESSMRAPREPLLAPVAPPPPTPAEQLDSGRALIRSSVLRVWPSSVVGEPLLIELGTDEEEPLDVRVVHLGSALGADAAESLSLGLTSSLGRKVHLTAAAIPATALSRASGDLSLLAQVSSAIASSAAIPSVNVCVVEPHPPERRKPLDRRSLELGEALRAVLASHPRTTITSGQDWRVHFTRSPCTAGPDVPASHSEARAAP